MPADRAGVTYRVEIIRDESLEPSGVAVDITAYIDREPDDNEAEFGTLSRVPANAWNTRMLYTGDFGRLTEAVSAVQALYPEVAQVNCYEWGPDESVLEAAPLVRSGAGWLAAQAPAGELTGRLDWRIS